MAKTKKKHIRSATRSGSDCANKLGGHRANEPTIHLENPGYFPQSRSQAALSIDRSRRTICFEHEIGYGMGVHEQIAFND